jgi:hypothetical protein
VDSLRFLIPVCQTTLHSGIGGPFRKRGHHVAFFRQLHLEQAQRASQPMENVSVVPFVKAPRTLTRSLAALAERCRLVSPLHALPEVLRNHRFPRLKPLGLSFLARQASQLVTAALPNTSSVPI